MIAVNEALFWLALTMTLAGTVTAGSLLESSTIRPPEGAAELRITVHVAEPGAPTFEGVQLSEVSEAVAVGREIVPAIPPAGIELPAAVEAATPVIWMGIDVVDGLAAI